jgi:hypothetical protein
MAELYANGHLVDLILIVVALEVLFLIGMWRFANRGVQPADVLPNLISGALMLLALRLTLGGAGWVSPIICLSIAGVVHLYDIGRRWRS